MSSIAGLIRARPLHVGWRKASDWAITAGDDHLRAGFDARALASPILTVSVMGN